ncbi:hypothetical protein [Nocardia sp. NRRL WC-3656]|uniref:hypothetical protein n=1 Tax=Nocardia sp. NRRL WC-3656 TaxID=1463824 RepID=UPI0004C3D903|nr:hypothetical protein [Nocardia sp. NRRL WC-3656]
MQLISGTAATDSLSALYVGSCGDKQWWTARWLPGRRLSTDEAVIGTIVAEMLLQRPAAGEQQWTEIGEGARLLGLSIRDLAGFLGVDYEIPETPSTPDSTGRHRRKPLWLPGKR